MGDALTKSDAQERANRIRAFREELAELERERVIELTDAQRDGLELYLAAKLSELAEKYDIDTTESQKQLSWGMRIASALGGLALCAAVFLLFCRFWGAMTTPVQVAILVASPVLAVLLTDFAARRERTLYFAMLAAMVAFACFVLDLNMLGSIFNLTPSPHAFLAWAAFGLALAYAFRLRLLLAAGLVCALVWLSTLFAAWGGLYWTYFGARAENVLAAGIILIAVAAMLPKSERPDFVGVYGLIGLIAVFLALFLPSVSGELSYLPYSSESVERFYQLAGLAASAGVIWAGIRLNTAAAVNFGATSFIVFLYIRLYVALWDVMPKYLFFFLLGLISVGLLVVFQKLRRRRRA
jgi:uncharacterized membrane protein